MKGRTMNEGNVKVGNNTKAVRTFEVLYKLFTCGRIRKTMELICSQCPGSDSN